MNNANTMEKIVSGVKNTTAYDRCASSQEFFDAMHPMGTDKTSRHGYHWFYGPQLQQFRTKPGLKILEIGAKEGRSAAGWTKYFDDATVDMMTYGGAKNDLTFERMECKLGDCSNVTRFEGDQSDTDFLDTVLKQRQGGWDIIIDDASHVPAHNIITFEHLWKNVRPGGLYVVEDIETSYYPKGRVYGYDFEAGMLAPSEQNVMIRFQKYADVMNRGYFPAKVKDFSLFEGDHLIEEVGYSRNIIYVRKAAICSIANKTSLDYPQGPASLPGKETITASVEEAKKIFMEGTKYLEQWYTAPSFKRGKE